jgi:hypothetical protein
MPTQFPLSPTVGDQYDLNGTLYQWNGEAWIIVSNISSGGGGGGTSTNIATTWWFGV